MFLPHFDVFCDLLEGGLRNHNGYDDENVTSKYKFELFLHLLYIKH